MLRLSKKQFSRAIEGSDVTADKNAPGAPIVAHNQSTRTSKFLVTGLVVALGIGAGWIGGKVLNGRMSHSTAASPSSGVLTGDNPAVISHPQPESRPVKRADTPEKPLLPVPEVEQPAVASESQPKEAEPKDAPPKVPRVEKEEEADKATAEEPSKEIGREALKKMSKETKKSKRAPGNKNENEDRQY